MRIGIFTKPGEPRAIAVSSRIAEWAASNGVELLINDRLPEIPTNASAAPDEEIAAQSEFIVALGGDGTMLAVARLLALRGTPVLGVNLGTLGYLTEFTVEEAVPALEEILGGTYVLERRTMVDWRIVREPGQEHEHEPSVVAAGAALNDVVVNKATLSRVIEIDCTVGGHYVTTYRADGLIIATPTGSTAYNLSAGGPIICPSVGAVSIAPICPHTLTNRPLILPDSEKIELQLKTRDQEVMFTADGHTGVHLLAGDKIEVVKSQKTFNTVSTRDKDYFQILRNKLKWSGR